MRIGLRLAVGAALGLAAALGGVLLYARRGAAQRRALFEALRPVRLSNCTFERVGHPNDGGYVMCENLLDEPTVAYSYGIEDRDDWGCEISRTHHVAVHEYDCFDTRHPACDGGQLVFHPECVGPKAETIEGRPYDSVTSQIDKNGDHGKHMVMKMDVEGSEWDSLLATPDEVLDRIEQLAIELHGIDEPKFLEVVQKLKKTFYVVNVHANNNSCKPWPTPWYSPFPGWAYEVLFVNRRVAKLSSDASLPPIPNPLDAPNRTDKHDCAFHWD